LQDIDNLVTEVKNTFGKIDVLFLNAGVASFSPIEFTTEDQFDTLVDTNFKGSFFTLQKFISILNEGASVVFLTAGITGMNMANSAAYSASKSAVSHLAKIAAKELAPKKIRVNIVSPGPISTEIEDKMGLDKATITGMKEKLVSQVPLAKMGVPEDVAKMVTFLSDNTTSSFITGSEFLIDGRIAL
jgi:NAD(P)-dependent dehydrogenase (short-subunit alcohol dehydrogenase family)